jgi:signal transduction histidine kinase
VTDAPGGPTRHEPEATPAPERVESGGFGDAGRSGSIPPLAQTPLPGLVTPSGVAVTGAATATLKIQAARSRRALPLLPLPPLIVIVVGLAVAVAIGIVGVDHLARASDEHAALEADLLAATMAARIAKLPPATAGGAAGTERLEALQLAARRTGSEFLLLTYDGEVVLDASLGAPDRGALKKVIALGRGEAITGLGRTRFSVQPLGPPPAAPQLVAFVREPSAPEGGPAFVTALLALTTLLVGVAATVAYAVARDANEDVVFITQRVRGMAHVRTEPTGEPVPVRTIDEIGVLTGQFNALVGRFAAAERGYHENLSRAHAADRDRAAFLAAVSHELRSPLNAILGFADILATEVDGPLTQSAREEVEQIRGSGAHLLELISDILEFSALESGQLKLSRARVDLTQLAGEVVRESQGLLGDKPQVQLRLEGEPGVIADADARRVRQILTNLVGNAIKFTQAGQVVVTISKQGSYASVSVTDTGPGINAAERAMIFEEYKQASDERTRKRGTGLGLAIARRLVLMHGGTIHVESELGRGSTFRVLVPLWFDRADRIAHHSRTSHRMRAARHVK